MIDAGVRIVDLDPEGFSWLNRCLSARDQGRQEVSVLHDGATVIQVAGLLDGREVAVGDAVDDASILARSVADATGADLVTVIDSRGLDALSSSIVELGRACRSQGELLWRSREEWNAHPGVVMVPPPEPSRWPAIEALLASVPDERWIVVRVRADGAAPTVLAGRVRSGLIIEVTSAEPDAGDVAAELETDRSSVELLLGADDPFTALLELLGKTETRHRGLSLLPGSA